jgi:hypothetical protein
MTSQDRVDGQLERAESLARRLHGGEALVKRVYGHRGTVRHRSEVMEYRVEQYREELRPKLELLRSA